MLIKKTCSLSPGTRLVEMQKMAAGEVTRELEPVQMAQNARSESGIAGAEGRM
jgi:hypothetical protein